MRATLQAEELIQPLSLLQQELQSYRSDSDLISPSGGWGELLRSNVCSYLEMACAMRLASVGSRWQRLARLVQCIFLIRNPLLTKDSLSRLPPVVRATNRSRIPPDRLTPPLPPTSPEPPQKAALSPEGRLFFFMDFSHRERRRKKGTLLKGREGDTMQERRRQ